MEELGGTQSILWGPKLTLHGPPSLGNERQAPQPVRQVSSVPTASVDEDSKMASHHPVHWNLPAPLRELFSLGTETPKPAKPNVAGMGSKHPAFGF